MCFSRIVLVVVIFAGQVASTQDAYFPTGTLASNAKVDQFRADWYSKHLRALNEPSLTDLAKQSSIQSYRLVWLRTFHHPIVVRLELNENGSGVLFVKEADGAGGYETGQLIENSSRPVTRKKASEFLKKVKEVNFWSFPSYKEDPDVIGV